MMENYIKIVKIITIFFYFEKTEQYGIIKIIKNHITAINKYNYKINRMILGFIT